MSGPLILAVESSCDETGVALVEDGRRIHANVVASQIALHAPTGGIVPEVAARAHLRWIVPALDEALETAGVGVPDVDAVAVTYGPGLAGSLLVGINVAKSLAWAHDKPLIPVNHLEGHVYAGWLLDPGEAEHEAPPFPLVALVVSGGHTFLVEMRDHLDYRLLGQTVDDAAGEAFDKVGRLLGLGYPGGPAISRAAEGAKAKDRVFPRAWLGGSYDLSFSGLKTAARRIVDRGPGRRGTAGRRARGQPARARRRGARVGVPGLGGRRADDEDDPGGRGGGRPGHRAGRRRGRERGAPAAASRARPRRAASRWSSRDPACAPTTGR